MCLSVREHISGTTRPIFISVHVTYGRRPSYTDGVVICYVLPLCGWRRVCTQWPGKMTRKGHILKVTQQGAARIWHGSVQTNWPSNGPGTKSDIYDLPCQVMDSRSTPSRSGFKYQPQTTCLQIISIAKQYNVVDKSSLKSCSHTLD